MWQRYCYPGLSSVSAIMFSSPTVEGFDFVTQKDQRKQWPAFPHRTAHESNRLPVGRPIPTVYKWNIVYRLLAGKCEYRRRNKNGFITHVYLWLILSTTATDRGGFRSPGYFRENNWHNYWIRMWNSGMSASSYSNECNLIFNMKFYGAVPFVKHFIYHLFVLGEQLQLETHWFSYFRQ